MTDTTESPYILVNALLAGHTVVARRDTWWVAQEITSSGQLGEGRPLSRLPSEGGWRLGLA